MSEIIKLLGKNTRFEFINKISYTNPTQIQRGISNNFNELIAPIKNSYNTLYAPFKSQISSVDDYFEILDDDLQVKGANVIITPINFADTTYKLREGLFVISKLKGRLNSDIYIRTENLKETIDTSKIDIDNSDFEKYFNVFAQNKITAVRLLTSDITSELIEFREKYNIRFDIIIKSDIVSIMLYSTDLFEPEYVEIDKSALAAQYVITKFTVDVIKHIHKAIEEANLYE